MVHFPAENPQPGAADGNANWRAEAERVFDGDVLVASVWARPYEDPPRYEDESWLEMRLRTQEEREDIQREEPFRRARLIASAPDLLEHLIALVECGEHGRAPVSCRLMMARAAIAKATGQ